MNDYRVSVLLVLLFAAFSSISPAQQANNSCAMPAFSNVVNEPNIFNEQQEEWLGEIVAPQIEKQFNVIADPQNDYLQKLGARILAQLPPTQMHYHFTIIDLPSSDSFGLPGGYIYLSRKIIALAQNEDELAGLLGHEIGHIITHQIANDMSRVFREVLGVTQVGDRKDILEKWNRLLDSAKKSPKFNEKREQKEQLIADRVAVYAMTRAGYQPSRFADFFDRLTQIKGNKGNFWTDLFGSTSPESKRLREMVHNAAPLPTQCITPVATNSAANFPGWQKAVIESGLAAGKEEIPGLVSKVSLAPPLRNDLRLISFSPNGKFLLAQDDSSVFVMSREPLANLFRFDALDAEDAQFTPDSQSIVFVDKELRVEKWDIESKQRSSVHQITMPLECRQKTLSPTGDLLACVTLGVELQLACSQMTEEHTWTVAGCDVPVFDVQMVDIAANKTVLTHKALYSMSRYEALFAVFLEALGLPATSDAQLHFSPDGHYFAAGHGPYAFAWDLQTRSEVKLQGKPKAIIGGHFVFRGADEIAGFSYADSEPNLYRYRFPSGQPIDGFGLPASGALVAPVRGEYLLMINAGNSAVAVIDLQAKKIVMAYKVIGFNIYGATYAAESIGGGVVLANLSDQKNTAQLRLPISPLHDSKVATFSPNGKWLAISGPNRGGMWDLSTGKRTFLSRAFEGAMFDEDQLVVFTGGEKEPGKVIEINTATLANKELFALPAEEQPESGKASAELFALQRTRKFQLGPLLISNKMKREKKGFSYQLEVSDIRMNRKLWDRTFEHESPKLTLSRNAGTLTMLFSSYSSIKELAKDDPFLSQRLSAMQGKEEKRRGHAIIVVEGNSGKRLGSILVDTAGVFKITSATATGDTVIASDSENRTLVYSLKSGELKGKIFGASRAVSKDGTRMLVDNGKGDTDVYDTSTLQPLVHFSFPSRIVHAEFSDDGNNIRVLTGDQMVYSLKTAGAEQAAVTSGNS